MTQSIHDLMETIKGKGVIKAPVLRDVIGKILEHQARSEEELIAAFVEIVGRKFAEQTMKTTMRNAEIMGMLEKFATQRAEVQAMMEEINAHLAELLGVDIPPKGLEDSPPKPRPPYLTLVKS